MTTLARIRRLIRSGGEFTVRGVARVLFVLGLLVVTGIAVSASAPLVASALAMFIAYLMVRTVLPAGTISRWLEDFWSGDLFINVSRRIRGWFPW